MWDEGGNSLEEILSGIWFYYVPVCFVFCTIANFLCIFVPHRTEMKNMVSRYYFISLTISNELWIIFIAIDWLVRRVENDVFTEAFCSLSSYVPTVLRFLSKYFTLAFMIERYNTVRLPPRRQGIKKTKIITIGIMIIGCLLAGVTFWLPRRRCAIIMRSGDWRILILFISEIIIDFVPFIITIILSIRIFTMIRGSSMGRILEKPTNGINGIDPAGQQSSSIMSVKEISITKMLIILPIADVYLSAIWSFLLLLSLYEIEWSLTDVSPILSIVNILCYTCLGINIVICCVVDQDFRQATWAIIRCRGQPNSTTQQTLVYTRINSQPSAPPLVTYIGE